MSPTQEQHTRPGEGLWRQRVRTNGESGTFERRDDRHFVTGNVTAQMTPALRVR